MSSNSLTLTINELKPEIINCFKSKVVPMLTSSPGLGKSSLMHQVADELNLQIVDIRLAQIDPVELGGFPHIYEDTVGIKHATYVPMDIFPLETTPVPKGKAGWLIFLDEFNSAPVAVQAAAYKLVLDRMVGNHKLHKNVAIACAGNKMTDGAIVNRQGTAMQSRLVHFEMEVSPNDWFNWAYSAQIDPRIIAFLQFSPGKLHKFDPNHNDKTFPCPRTWEFASRLTRNTPDLKQCVARLSGAIGEGTAREYITYCEVFDKLPKLEDILANPETTEIPEEPSIAYALTSLVGEYLDKDNSDKLTTFMRRMEPELTGISLRIAFGGPNAPGLLRNPNIVKLFQEMGREYADVIL